MCNGSDVGSLNTHFFCCNDSVVRKCSGMNLKQQNWGGMIGCTLSKKKVIMKNSFLKNSCLII